MGETPPRLMTKGIARRYTLDHYIMRLCFTAPFQGFVRQATNSFLTL